MYGRRPVGGAAREGAAAAGRARRAAPLDKVTPGSYPAWPVSGGAASRTDAPPRCPPPHALPQHPPPRAPIPRRIGGRAGATTHGRPMSIENRQKIPVLRRSFLWSLNETSGNPPPVGSTEFTRAPTTASSARTSARRFSSRRRWAGPSSSRRRRGTSCSPTRCGRRVRGVPTGCVPGGNKEKRAAARHHAHHRGAVPSRSGPGKVGGGAPGAQARRQPLGLPSSRSWAPSTSARATT